MPTARAMKAAKAIFDSTDQDGSDEALADLIDRATGLPKLEACIAQLLEESETRRETIAALVSQRDRWGEERDALAQRLEAIQAACSEQTGKIIDVNDLLRILHGDDHA